jgi:membrane-bound serine protease (ClpP class)
MREMSQALLGSPVPVAVYVAPSGARAASAGMFLTIAAHVAAMAPGTSIGAAHPIAIGGQAHEVKSEKATSDLAALARAIAHTRGRNATWVERAVRESLAFTAEEALAERVIDVVAKDLPTLLRALDGRRVRTSVGEVTIETSGAQVHRRAMTRPDRIVQAVADPNVAYLLFLLGLIGVAAELLAPGLLVPGLTGAVALTLAFVAFGSLPLNWAGLLLLVLAAALFIAELSSPGIGALGIGGACAFVIGSLILYSPVATMPHARVNPWLVGVAGAAIAGFFLFVLRAFLQTRRTKVTTGIEGLVGRTALATTELAPFGTVELDHELWRAQAAPPATIHRGERVEVIGVEKLTSASLSWPSCPEPVVW